MTRFLGSLRARLLLLHPSPNCSFRAESLVHVHFKEEIGVAELVPLVTTYIILFAYIYFSTCTSRWGGGAQWAFPGHWHPCLWKQFGPDAECALGSQKPGPCLPAESRGLGWVQGSSGFSGKDPFWGRVSKDTSCPPDKEVAVLSFG